MNLTFIPPAKVFTVEDDTENDVWYGKIVCKNSGEYVFVTPNDDETFTQEMLEQILTKLRELNK